MLPHSWSGICIGSVVSSQSLGLALYWEVPRATLVAALLSASHVQERLDVLTKSNSSIELDVQYLQRYTWFALLHKDRRVPHSKRAAVEHMGTHHIAINLPLAL